MSYEPLHHKYRPQTFRELVGQEAIATTLSNALRQRRIAPAYLFTGARGTGKTSSARIFAKSLNCLSSDAPTPSPCGKCEVCRAIALGSALDVIEIDAASNTGVDNIRELIERAQFAPVQCRYKVYVIDEVHMLSNAAFNALLKTLEEPPNQVVFVLATTDPQRVLATIISRCQRFDFRRIPLEAMVAHLGTIAQKEGIPITDDAIQLVAQLSQGGLRDAESSLDQLSLLDGEITPERVWDLVGAVPEQDLLALMGAIAQDQPEALIDRVRQLMDRGREPSIVLQNLASFYRDLLIAKTAPDRGDLVTVTAQTWKAMVDFVSTLSVALLQQGQQHLRSSEAQIRNSAQPRLWLEVTLLGLLPSAMATVAPVPAPGIAAQAGIPATRVAPPPTPVAPAPAAQAAPAPAPTARPAATSPSPVAAASPPAAPVAKTTAPPPAPETDAAPVPMTLPEPTPVEVAATVLHLEQTWQQVLGLVQPNSTQILLRQQCFLLAYSGQEARIGVKAAPLLKIASSRHGNIEAAFEQYAGHRVRVTLEVAEPLQPGTLPTTTAKLSTSAPTPPAPATPSPPRPAVIAEAVPNAGRVAAIAQPPAPIATPEPDRPAALEPEPISMAPPPIASRWDEDPLVRAANNVASFFNGQVIRWDEADVLPGGKLPGDDWADETSLGDEGDDVPF
ncbi:MULTISPECIES: DNA polymerase III subunit gamma/tau [unclassified Leptolyngbya]|uniref:DNA polymerase III subunit gamma/tau n=1 Tax=unclassified Leptolyngbya TaxID=2650499 RepID=UPI0016830BA6|nr:MULTISPECIES: DNA polymerase III subunit gamma/tau [unclassified Leptolyngbya]MBD1912557.1 DNA polymerase III subunit gamma/tau [Leptolyngbya sp. FACHB-8]MBD2154910.1 DNA polymerase III subunit gamma/tau [Leptolyngbya sp. FACHB-16]